MAKKRRSAKQLANDRRLGRMAKARAKAARGGGRKKTRKKASKKVTRRRRTTRTNPHPTRRRRPARRRKTATKRKAAKTRGRDYVIFKCNGSSVTYLGMTSTKKFVWTGDRRKALHWTDRGYAMGIAKKTRGATGVAGAQDSKSTIAADCKTGKA